MKIFDFYIFRNLLIATIFVSLALAAVIFLTQSLRFLELVVESGASSVSFWLLTVLALPRFFEVILPLALMAAVIFVYNRMIMDSELLAVRSAGYSPLTLAKPAIVLSIAVTLILLIITMWVAPKSMTSMNEMRQAIRAQFSSFLFRPNVFNQIGSGLTVYIRERSSEGDLSGLMIYDSREGSKNPSTILAKRGVLVSNDGGYQVLVYDGSRQEYDHQKETFHKLNFERYTIDLPENDPISQRWQEPDERTIFELLKPNMGNNRDVENLRHFRNEIHRRIVSPLLSLSFTLISCCALLLGPLDRRGQGVRIALAIACVVCIESLFLFAFNLTWRTDWGLSLAYLLVFLPILLSIFMLSGMGENFRRRLLFEKRMAL